MDLLLQITLALGITVMLSVLLGVARHRRQPTLPGFFYANYNLGPGATTNLLLSSPLSVNGILYQAFLGYAIGWAAVFTQVAWCISYLWLRSYRKQIREQAKSRTLHGAIGLRFGIGTERAAALASLIGFTLLFGWEIIVGTAILSSAAPNRPLVFWLIALGLALVAAAYTMTGGLRGNVRANRLQNLVACLSLIVLTVYLFYWSQTHAGAAGPFDGGSISRLVTVLGIGGLLTNIAFSLLWQFVDMSTWQTVAASDSDEGADRSLVWSTFWIFLFPGAFGTAVGMFVRSLPNLDPNTLLPSIIGLLADKPFLSVFVLSGFVCALLSTIDGVLLSLGQASSFDLLRRTAVNRVFDWYKSQSSPTNEAESGEEEEPPRPPTEIVKLERDVFYVTRLSIIGTAIAGSLLTLLLTQVFHINIFDLVYIVTVAQMVLFPVVWYSLRSRGPSGEIGKYSIWAGLSLGVILVVLLIALNRSILLQWVPLAALAVSAAVLRSGGKAK